MQIEQPARMPQQPLALEGGAHRLDLAVDQTAIDDLLQPADLHAHGGLGAMGQRGGRREAAGIGDGDEAAQQVGVEVAHARTIRIIDAANQANSFD